MPNLFSIVYTSVETDPFDDESLGALLAWCRNWNGANDVTGFLLYREGRFIQFLEGPEQTVRDLVASIAADSRHTRVRVLLEELVTARQYPEWTMGYEPLEDADAATQPGFRKSFDDLESGDDRVLIAQAARDLTLWFRNRAQRPA